MALLLLGPLAAQISGSIGGLTFARNKGGDYCRNRTVPVAPQTILQLNARAAFGALSARWGSVLTAAQRSSWDAYAAAVPLVNPLGESISVSGQNMYIRGNMIHLLGSLSPVDNAPFTNTLGPAVADFEFTATGSTSLLEITSFSSPADPADNVLIQQSGPQNTSVNFYKGPWRIVAVKTVATILATYPAPYPILGGQLTFLRMSVLTPDGRLGQDRIESKQALP